MKFMPLSLATALASSVLPVPGAPNSRTPERWRMGRLEKRTGYWKRRCFRLLMSEQRRFFLKINLDLDVFFKGRAGNLEVPPRGRFRNYLLSYFIVRMGLLESINNDVFFVFFK